MGIELIVRKQTPKMDPEAAKQIGQVIVGAVSALDSAPVQKLDDKDKSSFFELREQFDKLILDTHAHCVNYAAVYVYVAHCMCDGVPEEGLLKYLANHNFSSIVESAKHISVSSCALCLRVKTFIQILKTKYSRAVFYSWDFFLNMFIAVAGVACVAAGCSVPGAQPFIVSGALLIVASFTREASRWRMLRSGRAVDSSINDLMVKLEHLRDSVSSIRTTATTYSEKLDLVKMALGMKDSGNEVGNGINLKFIGQMCVAFEELQKAVQRAVGAKEITYGFNEKFAQAGIDISTAVVVTVATAQVVTNSETALDAVETVAHVSSCSIM
jgi:hypothetical protein